MGKLLFQQIFENLWKICSTNVIVYIDDIQITGNGDVLHLETLKNVFIQLNPYGLRLKKSECITSCNTLSILKINTVSGLLMRK